jgi:hypothetical protein
MSSVGTKRNLNRKTIGHSFLDEPQTDLKDAQVTTIVAIHKMTQALMNGISADRDQPDV